MEVSSAHLRRLSAVRTSATAYLQSSATLYNELDDSQKQLASTLMSNLPETFADQIAAADNPEAELRKVVSEFTNKITSGGSGLTNIYESILSDVNQVNSMNEAEIMELSDNLDKLAEKIGFTRKEVIDLFGLDGVFTGSSGNQGQFEIFEQNLDGLTNKTKEFNKNISTLDLSQMEIFNSVVEKNRGSISDATAMWQAYKDAALDAALAAGESGYTVEDALADGGKYNAAKSAKEAGNDKGTTYASMKEMLDEANELYKNGDIGTTTFKSIASMFNREGLDNADIFSQNTSKYARYFQEDSTKGVSNFLNDLEAKDLAEYDAKTKQWTLSIGNLEDAASKLGIGFEPFMAMMDELEAKGGVTDFFQTSEEGYAHLGDLNNQLMIAQQELEEGKGTKSKSWIKDKEDEIAQLKSRIEGTKDSLDKMTDPKKVQDDMAAQQKTIDAYMSAVEKIPEKSKSKDTSADKSTLFYEAQTLQSEIDTAFNTYGVDAVSKYEDRVEALNKKLREYGVLDSNGEVLQLHLQPEKGEVDDTTQTTNDLLSGISDKVASIAAKVGKEAPVTTQEKEKQFESSHKVAEERRKSEKLKQTPDTIQKGTETVNKTVNEVQEKVSTEETKTTHVEADTKDADAALESTAEKADEAAKDREGTVSMDTKGESGVRTLRDLAIQAAQNRQGYVDVQTGESKSRLQGLWDLMSKIFGKSGGTVTIGAKVVGTISEGAKTVKGFADKAGKIVKRKPGNTKSSKSKTPPKAYGTLSFARGSDITIDRDQMALVNELGEYTPRINLFNCGKILRALYTTT